MSAFLSGEMKDTVQVNPAGAYGTASPSPLFGPGEGTDFASSSTGAVLFKERASKTIPQLGWERQHVGQGGPL